MRDLYGLRGYSWLRRLFLASSAGAAMSVLAAGWALTARPAVLAPFSLLLCAALFVVGQLMCFFLDGLSGEIQRLDSRVQVHLEYVWPISRTLLALFLVVALGLLAGGSLLTAVSPVWLVALLPLVGAVCLLVPSLSSLVIVALSGSHAKRRTLAIRSRALAFPQGGVERLILGCDTWLSETQCNPHPAPRGLSLVNVPTKPWYDPAEIEVARTLEAAYPIIKAELLALLESDPASFRTYSYGKVGGAGWKTYHFHVGKQRIVENTTRCPETTRIIESIPHFHVRHPVFSALAPGARAAPHRDLGNSTLNIHLGLIVPAGCHIRVGAETRSWQEGKCIVFDTSYEHEVWNDSDALRVVLQVTTVRPELTQAEIDVRDLS